MGKLVRFPKPSGPAKIEDVDPFELSARFRHARLAGLPKPNLTAIECAAVEQWGRSEHARHFGRRQED